MNESFNLTERDKERRRRQSFIVEQLARILDWPSHRCWPLAGNLMRRYSYQFTLDILQRIQPGTKLSYIIGALRNEAFKAGIFKNQTINDLAEKMRAR